jgi:hypothetical protein
MRPQKGEIWIHYKHDSNGPENNFTYEIMGLVVHTETEDILVCYKPLYESEYIQGKEVDYFVRPLSMWDDHIEKNEYSGPRFKKLQK